VRRSADDAPRPDIEHHGEIEKPRARRHVGNVGDPQAVGTVRRKLALDLVDGPIRGRIANGRRHESARL
jgi:hypothetical protein